MNSKWYVVEIKKQGGDVSGDWLRTHREVVRFIARETGMTQREVRNEVFANQDSAFNRDSRGFRAQVTCEWL